MKVLLKLGSQENFIQKAYTDFSRRCLDSIPEYNKTKSDFRYLGDLFIHEKKTDDFCEKTVELSRQLNEKGKSGLGDLLINELSKLCLRLRLPQAEDYLKIALENSRKKSDGLHELARLTDLEYLYKTSNDRKNLFSILRQKKACCKKLIENYDENVSNYATINRAPTTKDGIKTQLAYTYSDLAGMLERRKPEDAINLYSKSQNIYIELGQQKETDYLKERIRRITARINKNVE